MVFDELFLTELLIRMPPVLLALTVHELMHGWVALRCGDPTAKNEGRVTLNPVAHLDPLGTLCLMFGPIGWAKPVPIMPENFRHRKSGEILVSLAGVTSNVVLAIVFCLLFRLLVQLDYVPETKLAAGLVLMLYLAILVNFGLALFNLLPIAPLDGHHVVRELLPHTARVRFMEFSPYGPVLLLGLVLLNRGQGLRFLGYPVEFLMRTFAGEKLSQYAILAADMLTGKA